MNRYYFQPRKELRGILKTIQILDLPDLHALKIGNRFLPDGFFEIGFNLGSDDLKITSSSVSDIQLENPLGYFYGQCRVSSILVSKGRLHLMIVKIYPWAASLFFDFNLSDCVDYNLELNQVFGKEIKCLEEKIFAAKNYKSQIEILEDYLMAKLIQRNNSINELLEKTTRIIFRSNGNIRIKDLAAQVHSSPRTVQRVFRQYYGISPKLYSQQLRLRYFASQLSMHKNKSLTELALHCGYFDQAHFNHEFKSIARVKPREFFFAETPLVDDFLKFS